MPTKRPAYIPGGIYHIFNRGSHRQEIFRESQNYLFVIGKIKHYLPELNLTMLAYCLMPNHYHFLIRQDGEPPAGLLSQRVFNSYSKAFNKRFTHSGTLFEGPYRVKQITNFAYLLQVCRYIHANPVKDGIVNDLKQWPYSNYLDWIGARNGMIVDREFVKDNFLDQKQYESFVDDFLRERELPAEVMQHLEQVEKAGASIK
jgi:putative transposase